MRKPHWPERWELRRGKIYYRPREHEKASFEGRSIYLLGKTEAEAFRTYYTRIDRKESLPRTLGAAMDLYLAGDDFAELADRTKAEYTRALTGPLRKVFGPAYPNEVMPKHLYAYLDKRPKVAGNRELAVLSNVFKLCVKRGACRFNPVRDVEKNKERPRERYVSDAELTKFLEYCSPRLKAYIELRMLTGMRQGQLLALRLSDWRDGELHMQSAKQGRKNIYHGPGLADAISRVIAAYHGESVKSVFLFCSRNGNRYTASGFQSIWQRRMAKYVTAGGEHFTEHDLRAKVASDSEDTESAQRRMAHQNASTTRRIYIRKPQLVEVLQR